MKPAFTLVEVMIAVALLSIVSAMAVHMLIQTFHRVDTIHSEVATLNYAP